MSLTAATPMQQAPRSAALASPGYMRALEWAFALFNTLRIVSYLPTILAIHHSASSDQYSVWTWIVWLGSNVTVAMWMYEKNNRQYNRVILLNSFNAAMCLVTLVMIIGYRM